MNTTATQHPPSAIEVLFDVLTNVSDGTEQEIAEAIADIWLPVFRTEKNLSMALEALITSHESAYAREMSVRYLEVMKGMK